MSEWKPKVFWKEAKAVACDGGFTVQLDGRSVRTPAKTLLVLPSMALAEAIADEWAAQEETVDPVTMPVTRSANAALDKVTSQYDEVTAMLASYAETDLLCHRADAPKELVERQAEAWDSLLKWAAHKYNAHLNVTSGILPVDQPADGLKNFLKAVRSLDAFAVTALHDVVSLSGSLVIGLAALEGVEPAETLWEKSRIDELWQEEQWGEDEEATEVASLKRNDFLHAKRFYDLSRNA